MQDISNVHAGCIWPAGRRFPTPGIYGVELATATAVEVIVTLCSLLQRLGTVVGLVVVVVSVFNRFFSTNCLCGTIRSVKHFIVIKLIALKRFAYCVTCCNNHFNNESLLITIKIVRIAPPTRASRTKRTNIFKGSRTLC